MTININISLGRKEKDPRAQHFRPPRSYPWKRLWLWSLLCTLVVAGILWVALRSGHVVPGKYRSQAKFTVFAPKHLPDGYAVDKQSFQIAGSALVFRVNGPNEQTFLVSEQHPPPDLNLADFQSKFKDKLTFDSAIGSVTAGLSENTHVASVTSNNTWIFISTGPKVALSELKTVMQAMRKD